jgi:hypothetical protein
MRDGDQARVTLTRSAANFVPLEVSLVSARPALISWIQSGPVGTLVPRVGMHGSNATLRMRQRQVERRRGAVCTFPRMAAGIEPAIPAPRIFARRQAGADRDRADAHVTVEHVPAFVGGIERAAAGELGHALLKRHRTAGTIPLPIGALGAAGAHDQADQSCS